MSSHVSSNDGTDKVGVDLSRSRCLLWVGTMAAGHECETGELQIKGGESGDEEEEEEATGEFGVLILPEAGTKVELGEEIFATVVAQLLQELW